MTGFLVPAYQCCLSTAFYKSLSFSCLSCHNCNLSLYFHPHAKSRRVSEQKAAWVISNKNQAGFLSSTRHVSLTTCPVMCIPSSLEPLNIQDNRKKEVWPAGGKENPRNRDAKTSDKTARRWKLGEGSLQGFHPVISSAVVWDYEHSMQASRAPTPCAIWTLI